MSGCNLVEVDASSEGTAAAYCSMHRPHHEPETGDYVDFEGESIQSVQVWDGGDALFPEKKAIRQSREGSANLA